MPKIIIEHTQSISDEQAAWAVLQVIRQGKISTSKHGEKYCHVSVTDSGIVICARDPRPNSDTNSFRLYRDVRKKANNAEDR